MAVCRSVCGVSAHLQSQGGDGLQNRADDADAVDGAQGDAVALVVQQPPYDRNHNEAKGHNDVGKVGVVVPVIPLVLQLQPGCAQVELYTEHLHTGSNTSIRPRQLAAWNEGLVICVQPSAKILCYFLHTLED